MYLTAVSLKGFWVPMRVFWYPFFLWFLTTLTIWCRHFPGRNALYQISASNSFYFNPIRREKHLLASRSFWVERLIKFCFLIGEISPSFYDPSAFFMGHLSSCWVINALGAYGSALLCLWQGGYFTSHGGFYKVSLPWIWEKILQDNIPFRR